MSIFLEKRFHLIYLPILSTSESNSLQLLGIVGKAVVHWTTVGQASAAVGIPGPHLAAATGVTLLCVLTPLDLGFSFPPN